MTAVNNVQFGYLPKQEAENKKTSSNYIRKIETLHSDDVKPISLNKFIKEIDAEYGEGNRKDTISYLYNQKENCHSGWKDFMARVDGAITKDDKLGGADQKYIADIAHRVSMKMLKP